MPFFKAGEETFDIPNDQVSAFFADNPEAEPIVRFGNPTDGSVRDVPERLADRYLQDYPSAFAMPSKWNLNVSPTMKDAAANVARGLVHGVSDPLSDAAYALGFEKTSEVLKSAGDWLADPKELERMNSLSPLNPKRIAVDISRSLPQMLGQAPVAAGGAAIGAFGGPAAPVTSPLAAATSEVVYWGVPAKGQFEKGAKALGIEDGAIASEYGSKYAAVTGLMNAMQGKLLGFAGKAGIGGKLAEDALDKIRKSLPADLAASTVGMSSFTALQTAVDNYFMRKAGEAYQRKKPGYSLDLIDHSRGSVLDSALSGAAMGGVMRGGMRGYEAVKGGYPEAAANAESMEDQPAKAPLRLPAPSENFVNTKLDPMRAAPPGVQEPQNSAPQGLGERERLNMQRGNEAFANKQAPQSEMAAPEEIPPSNASPGINWGAILKSSATSAELEGQQAKPGVVKMPFEPVKAPEAEGKTLAEQPASEPQYYSEAETKAILEGRGEPEPSRKTAAAPVEERTPDLLADRKAEIEAEAPPKEGEASIFGSSYKTDGNGAVKEFGGWKVGDKAMLRLGGNANDKLATVLELLPEAGRIRVSYKVSGGKERTKDVGVDALDETAARRRAKAIREELEPYGEDERKAIKASSAELNRTLNSALIPGYESFYERFVDGSTKRGAIENHKVLKAIRAQAFKDAGIEDDSDSLVSAWKHLPHIKKWLETVERGKSAEGQGADAKRELESKEPGRIYGSDLKDGDQVNVNGDWMIADIDGATGAIKLMDGRTITLDEADEINVAGGEILKPNGRVEKPDEGDDASFDHGGEPEPDALGPSEKDRKAQEGGELFDTSDDFQLSPEGESGKDAARRAKRDAEGQEKARQERIAEQSRRAEDLPLDQQREPWEMPFVDLKDRINHRGRFSESGLMSESHEETRRKVREHYRVVEGLGRKWVYDAGPSIPESAIREAQREAVKRALQEGKRIGPDVLASHPGVQNEVNPEAQNGLGGGAERQKPVADSAQAEKQESKVRRGKIGGKMSPSETVLTATGRETSPFPEFSAEKFNGRTLKQVDSWLINNAVAEARARGDEFNRRQFEQDAKYLEGVKELPQASKDSAEEYLFGERQPPVIPPILKPMGKAQTERPEPTQLEKRIAAVVDDAGMDSAAKRRQLDKLAKDSGKSIKEMQELAEGVVAERLRQIDESQLSGKEKFEAVKELYAKQPVMSVRTSGSMIRQAYSTPAPLAWLLGKRIDLAHGKSVYEPTAGTGMLIAGAKREAVHANELDGLRHSILESQGYKTTGEDALKLKPGRADRVIANPPFGSGKPESFDGFMISKLEHKIALRALEGLSDDGKAALILGAGREAGGVPYVDRVFMNYLYRHFNVLDNFEVDGKLYARQGASSPVRVITLDGRKERAGGGNMPSPASVERLSSWDDIYNKLMKGEGDGRADGAGDSGRRELSGRGATEGALQERAPAAERGGVHAGSADSLADAAGELAGGRRRGLPDAKRSVEGGPGEQRGGSVKPEAGAGMGEGVPARPVSSRSDASEHSSPAKGRPSGEGVVSQPEAPGAGKPGDGGLEPHGHDGGPEHAGERGLRKVQEPRRNVSKFQDEYVPQSSLPNLGTVVPKYLAGPMARALKGVAESHEGGVDGYLAERLGYKSPEEMGKGLAAEQIDGAALAISNIERGEACIIADQTGIGKGRQAAAVIRYAKRKGMLPVFFTVDPKLFSDMYFDGRDIGSEFKPLLIGDASRISIKDTSNKIISKGYPSARQKAELQKLAEGSESEHDSVFIPYSQITKPGWQQQLLESLANRYGDKLLVVMDEAHSASGGESNTGLFFKGGEGKPKKNKKGELEPGKAYDGILKNANAVYLSATYAKRPDNMPLYFKTGLKKAVDNLDSLPEIMKRGGLGMQQAVSQALGESGQMVRRERDFTGVPFDLRETGAKEGLREQFDKVSGVLKGLVDFSHSIREAVEDSNEESGNYAQANAQEDRSLGVMNFASVTHNYIKSLLLAVKIDSVAERALEAARAGKKPVIALSETKESAIEDYAQEKGLKPGDAIEMRWSDILLSALGRMLRGRERTEQGTSRDIDLDPASLGLGKEFDELRERIAGLDVELPVSPIDRLRNELERQGLKVGEITGRTLGIDYSGERPVLAQRGKGDKDKGQAINSFNGGEYDVLILNRSGSTGVSLHASAKFKDKRQRKMIVAQPELDINIMQQMLGRVLRSGQVVQPEYEFLTTPLAAEKRPFMMLAGKLKSLNANTTANTKSAVDMGEDFLNHYGDEVAAEFLQAHPDLQKHVEDKIERNKEGEIKAKEDLMRSFCGRIAVLPDAKQEVIYSELARDYRDYVEMLKASGEYDLEMQTHSGWNAKDVESKELKGGDPEGSVFQQPVTLKRIEIKIEKELPSIEEIRSRQRESFGEDGRGWRKDLEPVEEAVKRMPEELAGVEPEQAQTRVLFAQRTLRGLKDQMERIGREGVVLSFKNGDQAIAFLTGLRIGKINPKSPAVPSMFKLEFASEFGKAPLKISLGKLLGGDISVMRGFSDAESVFKAGKTTSSEVRSVITGNILRGMEYTQNGKVVSYRRSNGSDETGILLPKSWKSSDLKRDPRVEIQDPNEIAKLLDNSGSVSSLDGSLNMRRINGKYNLYVPLAARSGGKFSKDPELVRLIGGEGFVKVGKLMKASVDGKALSKILEHLKRKGVVLKDANANPSSGTRFSEGGGKFDGDLERHALDLERQFKRAFPELPVEVKRTADEAAGELDSAEDVARLYESKAAGFVTEGGKIVIVAESNASLGEGMKTALHEAVGHWGLRKALGEQFDKVLERLADFYKIEREGDWRREAEERFAKDSESYEPGEAPGWLHAAWSKVKDLLRALGFKMKFSDADIQDLLRRSHEAARRGGAPGGEGANAAFSRESNAEAWAKVKKGDDWNSVKKFIPRDAEPPKPMDVRGNLEEVAKRAQDFIEANPVVKAFDGRKILIANPEGHGKVGLYRRGLHLVSAKERSAGRINAGARKEIDIERAKRVYAIPETLRNADVSVRHGSDILYFKGYRDGIHLVVTDPYGRVVEQGLSDGALITHRTLKPQERFEGSRVLNKRPAQAEPKSGLRVLSPDAEPKLDGASSAPGRLDGDQSGKLPTAVRNADYSTDGEKGKGGARFREGVKERTDAELEPTWENYKESGKRDLMGFIDRLRRTVGKLRGKLKAKENAGRLVDELESFLRGRPGLGKEQADTLKELARIYKLTNLEGQQGAWEAALRKFELLSGRLMKRAAQDELKKAANVKDIDNDIRDALNALAANWGFLKRRDRNMTGADFKDSADVLSKLGEAHPELKDEIKAFLNSKALDKDFGKLSEDDFNRMLDLTESMLEHGKGLHFEGKLERDAVSAEAKDELLKEAARNSKGAAKALAKLRELKGFDIDKSGNLAWRGQGEPSKVKREMAERLRKDYLREAAKARLSTPTAGDIDAMQVQAGSWMRRFFSEGMKAETLCQMLDGFQRGVRSVEGAFYKRIYKPMDEASSKFSWARKDYADKMAEICKRHGLETPEKLLEWKTRKVAKIGKWDCSRQRLAGIYAHSLSAENKASLLDLKRGNEFSEADIAKASSMLTAQEKALVKDVLKLVDSNYGKMAEVLTRIGEPLPPRVEGVYVPKSRPGELTKHVFGGGIDVDKMFDGETASSALLGRSFTKERTGGNMELDLDFMDMVDQHQDTVNRFLTHAEPVKSVMGLLKDSDIRAAMIGRIGVDGFKQFGTWMRNICQPDWELRESGLGKIFGFLRHRAVLSVLSWRVSTAIVQTTQAFQSVPLIGGKWALQGFKELSADPIGARRWALEKSQALKDRDYFFDNDARESRNANFARELNSYMPSRKLDSLGQRIGEKYAKFERTFVLPGLKPMQWVDGVMATGVWIGAYKKALSEMKERGESLAPEAMDRKAVEYADAEVRRTQSSPLPKDQSQWQRGGEFQRMFMALQSYFNTTYNLMRMSGEATFEGRRGYAAFANDLFWVVGANGIAAAAVGAMLHGNPENEETWKTLAKNIGTTAFAGIPGLSIAANSLIAGYQPRLLSTQGAGKMLESVDKLAGGEFSRRNLKGLADGLSLVAGLPKQVVDSAFGAYDIASGEALSDADAVRRVLAVQPSNSMRERELKKRLKESGASEQVDLMSDAENAKLLEMQKAKRKERYLERKAG